MSEKKFLFLVYRYIGYMYFVQFSLPFKASFTLKGSSYSSGAPRDSSVYVRSRQYCRHSGKIINLFFFLLRARFLLFNKYFFSNLLFLMYVFAFRFLFLSSSFSTVYFPFPFSIIVIFLLLMILLQTPSSRYFYFGIPTCSLYLCTEKFANIACVVVFLFNRYEKAKTFVVVVFVYQPYISSLYIYSFLLCIRLVLDIVC